MSIFFLEFFDKAKRHKFFDNLSDEETLKSVKTPENNVESEAREATAEAVSDFEVADVASASNVEVRIL